MALFSFSQPSLAADPSRTEAAAVCMVDVDLVYPSRAQPFQALTQINLEIPVGQIWMVVGPAGAGKTTLLLVMAGLLTPTAGQVYWFGQDRRHLSRSQLTQVRLHQMGLIFAEDNLLHSLTALENIEVALNLKGMTGSQARREARHLLDGVGLGDKAHHLPSQLSGGQLQRVAIARGLAGRPPLIIADEPTAALDAANGRMVAQLLQGRSQQDGSTVILTTHDSRILPFADRVLHLEDGRLGAPPH